MPTQRWFNTNSERNQSVRNIRNVLPGYAYAQDNHFIHHENINQVPIRWFDSNLERRQFGRSIRNVLPTYADVQDNHFIFQENNINQVPIRREIIPTHRWSGTNRETNQHRLNTQDDFLVNAYGQVDHYILQENNINQAPVRRGIIPTQRRNNTNLERNQPRLSTRDALSAEANVQDDRFIFDVRNINQTQSGRDVEVSKRHHHTNLKIIQVEEGTKDSETMTCSICLVELLVGSRAIQLPSPCLHVYHDYCILKWLDISNTCPLCRRNVR
ncbi:uncharacterized protein LOC131623211 [Vicia villosa]|uniref:uncharacterized protein LOC131623211 n=1 Tax=Vicia villosa TaxID=3911 RepID=UPI00273A8A73|nr:uncharacterized protein LOC131623211 [Vicia villosa]